MNMSGVVQAKRTSGVATNHECEYYVLWQPYKINIGCSTTTNDIGHLCLSANYK